MSADLLLRFATICCGTAASKSVFEPLVADWLRQRRGTHGLRRCWVMLNGGAAFLRSLVACIDFVHVAQVKPATAFSLTLLLTVAAVAVQAQPFSYTWRPWLWSEIEIIRVPPDFDGAWLIPRHVGTAIVVAVLPVVMLATASKWRWHAWSAAAVVSAALVLTMNLWLAPASEQIRMQRRYAAAGYKAPPRSRDVTGELRTQGRTLLAMTGLTLIGAAAGRSRAVAQVSLKGRALAGWWVFGWVAYGLLVYWSTQLRIVFGTRVWFLIWLPQLTLIIAGAAALWMPRSRPRLRAEGERPTASEASSPP